MSQIINSIYKTVEIIEENLDQPLPINELAKEAGLSPWHFQRVFLSLVGDSLGGYIRGRKLSIAAEELKNDDKKIIDIALDSGFQSHEAFSRAFKSYFNLTPKAFRSSKPKIITQKMPIIDERHISHLKEGINTTPEFISFSDKRIVGIKIEVPSPFTVDSKHCEFLTPAWFQLLERESELSPLTKGDYFALYLSPVGDFSEEKLFYLVGVEVSSTQKIPEGMSEHHLKAQHYASFKLIKKKEDNMVETNNFIYGHWLNKSKFKRAHGFDIEYFHNVENFYDPELSSNYLIPIIQN